MLVEPEKDPFLKKVNSYQITKRLGRGGMGEVYLASHEVLERLVAIKRYAPAAGIKDKEAARKRFIREGKALAKLHHQGIVTVHDLFVNEDDLMMVIEYVDGLNISEMLKKGPMPHDVCCLIGWGLAEALEHAHFHGIIHRDVKTSNVMISSDGQVKLMDFGIARDHMWQRVTKTGILVGTPKYVPPEALLYHEQTKLGDVYGIGVVMYQCLSGKSLYYNAKEKDLYKLIMAGKFIPLDKIAEHVPKALRDIVHRCLARNPEKRFQSAGEFRCELDLYMAKHNMWLHRAERLSDFIQGLDEPDQVPLNTMDISEILSPISQTQRVARVVLLLLIGVALTSLGAFSFWGLAKLGWIGLP